MNNARRHSEIYIEVEKIHELWEQTRKFKARYRIRDLLDLEYGRTKFHINESNGCLVFIGEVTSR